MTKEIKQRIDQIKNGEVPQGYKKTKIGIFPNEWEEKYLRELLEFKNGFNAEKEKFGKGTKLISILDILSDKPIMYDSIKSYADVSEEEIKNYSVTYGDILFQRSSENFEDAGMSNVYLDSEKIAIFSGFVIRGKKISKYNPIFLNNLLKIERMRKIIRRCGAGAQHINIGQKSLSNIIVVLPPLNEQQKIADILSTQDKVIELKEKLLKEKEKQKKYLMQNLLTGKKRLKSFDGEWKKVKLGNLMNENNEFVGDRNIKPVAIGVYGIRQREDIFSKDLSKNYSRNKVFKNNQICFGIGTNQIVYGVNIVNKIYCVSPAYKVLDIVNIDPYYLKLLLDINNLRLSSLYLIISARQGKSVDFDGLFNEEFDIPLFEEQKAIAEILTTADKELKLLQEELEEEKRKKKALMQLLLTGIIRVKV